MSNEVTRIKMGFPVTHQMEYERLHSEFLAAQNRLIKFLENHYLEPIIEPSSAATNEGE